MRTGLIFSGGGTTIRRMAELAREAELAGLDAVYLCEAWRSGFVGLAAIALATEKVEIGPYILNAYGRSPWLTAMSAIDLDELSGGRLVLGIGTGNKHINEEWHASPRNGRSRRCGSTSTSSKPPWAHHSAGGSTWMAKYTACTGRLQWRRSDRRYRCIWPRSFQR